MVKTRSQGPITSPSAAPQTPGRPKNKVSAAKPFSPDIHPRPGPTQEDEHSVADGSVSSTSTTSSRPGLPLAIQKQLARDIESSGGIKGFKNKDDPQPIRQLLESKEAERQDGIYGRVGDPIRTQIRKKIWRWTKLDERGKYVEEILNPWKIKTFATLQKASRKAKRTGQKTEPKDNSDSSVSSSGSSSSSSSSSSLQAATSKKPRSVKADPQRADSGPPKVIQASVQKAAQTKPKPIPPNPKPKPIPPNPKPKPVPMQNMSHSPRSPAQPSPFGTGKATWHPHTMLLCIEHVFIISFLV